MATSIKPETPRNLKALRIAAALSTALAALAWATAWSEKAHASETTYSETQTTTTTMSAAERAEAYYPDGRPKKANDTLTALTGSQEIHRIMRAISHLEPAVAAAKASLARDVQIERLGGRTTTDLPDLVAEEARASCGDSDAKQSIYYTAYESYRGKQAADADWRHNRLEVKVAQQKLDDPDPEREFWRRPENVFYNAALDYAEALKKCIEAAR